MTDNELNVLVEQHVFSDDLTASTDERIALCILESLRLRSDETIFDWNGVEYAFPTKLFTDEDSYWVHLWHTRAGENYAADLEAYVTQWRHGPRGFLGWWDTCMLIFPAMEADGWHWALTRNAESDIVCRFWKADDVYRRTLASAGHPTDGRRAVVEASLKAKGVQL